MKKIITLFAIAVLVLATGCKKLPEFTQGSIAGGETPTTGGTLYYRLNGEPEITTSSISISAKYGSEGKITGMWLLVSEKADMPAGYTQYAEIQMNYPEFSVTLTGLEPSTYYFWCINYLENDNSYVTDLEEFTTLDDGATFAELIIGRWKTEATMPYYEVYYSNGTGKMWNTAEGVSEDEADTFDWSIDGNKLTQIIHFISGGGVVPQYCNIITLNETSLVYNNEGWRAEYTLTRVRE